MDNSDGLQLFSLASSTFALFIFYFKNMPINKDFQARYRGSANALLLCWFSTLALFILLLILAHFDLTELSIFMITASYAQFSIVGLVILMLFVNLLLTRLFHSGFIYNLVLPPLKYNGKLTSEAYPVDVEWFSLQIIAIFIIYGLIFFIFYIFL